MRIGLISDTHGLFDPTWAETFAAVDEIWHAGDVGRVEVTERLADIAPVRAVYGNVDGRDVRDTWPLNDRFECAGLDVWMTHIGGYPGRYTARVRGLLADDPPDVFICGHSHILKVTRDARHRNCWVLNPGAAGHHGFHVVRTVLRFTIDDGAITAMEAVELGRRGRS